MGTPIEQQLRTYGYSHRIAIEDLKLPIYVRNTREYDRKILLKTTFDFGFSDFLGFLGIFSGLKSKIIRFSPL